MDNNLNLYHIFYTVANNKNISGAAKELYISQPAISKAIAKLESNLNTKLFMRKKKDFTLTNEGKIALTYARRLKALHDKMIQKHEFNVGDYVLLYNSRLRFFGGKLLSKWEGPYVIEEVYRSGAIKINKTEGNFPRVVNGQRIKHYISGTPINVETNIINVITP